MRHLATVLLLGACVLQAAAYPSLYANKHATSCLDHPQKAFGAHGAPVPDPDTSFTFSVVDGGAVKSMCPGGTYTVGVKFPVPRLAMVTATAGSIGSDKRCWNRVYSGEKSLFDGFFNKITVPCGAAGQPLIFKASSAAGPRDAYHQATATIPVAYTDGDCAAISASAKCEPKPTPKDAPADAAAARGIVSFKTQEVPPTASAAATLTGAADAPMGDGPGLHDKILLAPVLGGNDRTTWACLHGALMLAAFALLVPASGLVSRHRWMFGRDPRTGKVLSSWRWVHAAVQLMAVLCALAGVALAVLGTGWKNMPSVQLFEPHKWIGVATVGAAILHFMTSQIPASESGPGAWRVINTWFGRLVMIAGLGNVFIGTVLIHGYYSQPYTYWLVPAAACTGIILLLAALLEAMKLQMQRTHRYDPRTDAMTDVWDIHYSSAKRGTNGGAAPANGGGAVDVVAAAAAAEDGAVAPPAPAAPATAAPVPAAAAAAEAAAAAATPVAVPAAVANDSALYPQINYSETTAGNFAGRLN